MRQRQRRVRSRRGGSERVCHFFSLNFTEIASLETTGGKRECIVLTADFYSLLSHKTYVFLALYYLEMGRGDLE